MGPRKRMKPNPQAERPQAGGPSEQEAGSKGSEVEATSKNEHGKESHGNVVEDSEAVKSTSAASDLSGNTPRSSRSWYGGTWSGKSKGTPITQVARESISAAASKISISDSEDSPKPTTPKASKQNADSSKSPSVYLSRAMASTSRSLPVAATTTKLHVSGNASDAGEQSKETNTQNKDEKERTADSSKRESSSLQDQRSGKHGAEEATMSEEVTNQAQETSREGRNDDDKKVLSAASAGWLGWLSKSQNAPSKSVTHPAVTGPVGESPVTQLGEAPVPQQDSTEITEERGDDGLSAERYRTSWLAPWSGKAKAPATSTSNEDGKESPTNRPATPSASDKSTPSKAPGESTKEPQMSKVPDGIDSGPGKPSAWAFWSKEKGQVGDEQVPNRDVGELAVANTSSQSLPKSAVIDGDKESSKAKLPSKRERPVSLENADTQSKKQIGQGASGKGNGTEKHTSPGTKKPDSTVQKAGVKTLPPNHVLPTFNNTFEPFHSPSILQQLAQLLYGKSGPAKHLHLAKDPPRIKKALAIGVHGYFPAPVLRTVLGQPTGTSVRFATAAAEAITKWTARHGYSCEIEKVALEGEGKISDRVDTLWRLMLNWIDHIKNADFILLACHSQGVPVTMMLVSKLIEFGCVSGARIGVCAMAGVNLGPFPDYKSRLWSGSAGELFEFANSESSVSKRYQSALRTAINHGVRILYVGSIDDQLVSLESALFSNIDHPYIYRAVFVDGRVHAPDFITHLVGFALKLRNLGISDHGLIRELSVPLAGSLYGGEGHSRIYDDELVYDLSVCHTLETALLPPSPPLTIQPNYAPPTSSTTNPYILPWALRGLLEEEYVRTQLGDETTQLLEQFERWKPNSKVLRDVKWRLEAVRSKL
ncbi:MAG: hypothetical protein M4579_002501 [Chaenotheca gracillima]|nr:MAG: hypothetical protein M4579_002501 [Chaenotheca gracillima]